jgi:hypothetical protein
MKDEDALRAYLARQTIYAWKDPSGLVVVGIA